VAKQTERLSDLAVRRASKPGFYADGRQLYLQVSPTGTKSWLFRFARHGRERWMGLGPYPDVPLAEARQKAFDARRLLRDGVDPIEARRTARYAARLDEARGLTFKDCAERYIAAHEAGWRNAKHRAQWRSTLETYAFPVLGELSVAAIDTALVMKTLEPIWQAKPETAGRLRGRIEAVLDWAAARNYRTGDNPARWRGHLDKLLPARRRLARVKHHAALPSRELPVFMNELRAQIGVSARALEFAILTAARTSEVIGATWGEIDRGAKVWTVPAERMKGGRPHRVPLCERALEILDSSPHEGDHVFGGARVRKPLSQMALLMTLRRMGRARLTVHGFRSTFRDWAAESTSFPREVAEAALAHAIPDKVEAAYRRGDLFERRRQLMQAWSRYCASGAGAGAVVPIRKAR
jgi:integrase